MDRCSNIETRSSDEQSRSGHLFQYPDTTPREKGLDGPLERPTSSDDPSTQVWEGIPTRQERIEEQIRKEQGLFDEISEQDLSNYSDKIQTLGNDSGFMATIYRKMAQNLEPYMQLLEYNGSENPKTYWFRCISIWKTRTTQDEKRQINEFGARLNGDALKWFIKVRKNIDTLDELEKLFIARFQRPNCDELAIS